MNSEDTRLRNLDQIKNEVVTFYNNILNDYNSIRNNESNINNTLSDFIINNNQISADVYGQGAVSKDEINLPADTNSYQKALATVNNDIEEIDQLIGHVEGLIEVCNNNELPKLDYDISLIVTDCNKLLVELKSMEQERIDVYNKLHSVGNYMSSSNFGHNKKSDSKSIGGINGGGGASGGGGGSSGGGSAAPSSSSGGNSNYQPTSSTSSTTTSSTYTPVLDFNNLNVTNKGSGMANIEATASNLEEHAARTSNILSNITFDGKNAVGSGVYDTNNKNFASEIECSEGDLQLALDFVDADITTTKALIEQMKTQIENNKATIESNNQKIEEDRKVEPEILVGYDDEGNPIYEHNPEYDVAQQEIADLTAENAELEAENERLEADITNYQNQVEEKTGVLQELQNYRQGLDELAQGNLDLFTASSLLEGLKNGDLSKYGITDEEGFQIFDNMSKTLENGNYSLLASGTDPTGKKMTQEEFNTLLSNCKDVSNAFKSRSLGDTSINPADGLNGKANNKYNYPKLNLNGFKVSTGKDQKAGTTPSKIIPNSKEKITDYLNQNGLNYQDYNENYYMFNDAKNGICGLIPKNMPEQVNVVYAWPGASDSGVDWAYNNGGNTAMKDMVTTASEMASACPNSVIVLSQNHTDSNSAVNFTNALLSSTGATYNSAVLEGHSNGVYASTSAAARINSQYSDIPITVVSLDSNPQNVGNKYQEYVNNIQALSGNSNVKYICTTTEGSDLSYKYRDISQSGNDVMYVDYHGTNLYDGFKMSHALDLNNMADYAAIALGMPRNTSGLSSGGGINSINYYQGRNSTQLNTLSQI